MSTTQTPPPPGAGTGPRISADEARDLTRLRRTTSLSPQGRRVAGVAGGIARHLDVDPLVVRVALVVLVFFGGAGLLLYVAGWLLVPEDGAPQAVIRLDDRTRNVVLWVVAALAALAVVGESLGRFHLPWPLILIGLFVLWVLTRRRKYDDGPTPWPTYPGAGPSGPSGVPGTEAPGDSGGDLGGGAGGAPAYGPPTGPPPGSGGWPGEAKPAAGSPEGRTARLDLSEAEVRQEAAPGAGTPGAPIPPDPLSRPMPPYRRPDPRKTGPILFWITLALVALAEGVLGIVDVAGAHVPSAAYPALALGLIGAMLVLGAFVGRAGGLIALGLVATLALVGTGISDHLGPRRTLDVTPTTAAAVAPSYQIGAGRITLDLSQVGDLAALDGRRIELQANVGKLEVVVPEGMGVDLEARVHGPGDVQTFGVDHGGVGITYDHVYAGTPTITLVTDLKVGQIKLRQPDGGTR